MKFFIPYKVRAVVSLICGIISFSLSIIFFIGPSSYQLMDLWWEFAEINFFLINYPVFQLIGLISGYSYVKSNYWYARLGFLLSGLSMIYCVFLRIFFLAYE